MTSTRRLLVPVLVVLVVAAAALTWWVATRPAAEAVEPAVQQDGSYTVGTIPGDGHEAVEAAVAALPIVLSYDFRTLDEGLDSAAGQMTDSFAGEFCDTFDKTVRAMATSKKAVTNASVRGAGVVRADNDKAVVLAYVDQVLVSGKQAKGANAPVKVSQSRVLVELRRDDGDWRIDAINPF
jgi:hypothetical protein